MLKNIKNIKNMKQSSCSGCGDFFVHNELLEPLRTLIYERGENMNVSRLVRQAQRGNKEALLELILAEQDAYYRLA